MEEILKQAISKDGAAISYRQVGNGEGLIISHGAGRISQNYSKLATALAPHFTVYIPDRRGRGLSADMNNNYGIDQATEDLAAVIKATGASYIFGHSAGALIALQTMFKHPVKKLAVYDPPVSVAQSIPSSWLEPFEVAIKSGKRKKAMAILLKGLQAHESMATMPLGLLRLLVNVISIAERKKAKGTRMLDLLPTITAEMNMVVELDSTQDSYKHINIPVLLMAGANSQHFFKTAVHVLENNLPTSATKIFQGLDHYSPEEKVDEIAAAMISFFKTG